MNSIPKSMVSIFARDLDGFGTVQVVDSVVKGKSDTILYVPTADESFAVYGTFDELLNFSVAVVAAVYGWALTNGHTDWLGDLVTIDESEVASNGGQDK